MIRSAPAPARSASATPIPLARPRWPGEFTVAIARDPLQLFIRLTRERGDAVMIRAAGRTFVIVAHPDVAREVLVTQQRRFVRGYAHRGLRLLLGDGLLTSEGEFHRRQRRLAQPAFHRDRIAGYAVAMAAAAERWSARWDGLAAAAPAGRAPVVDVAAEMTALTLGIAAETLFGTDVAGRAREVSDAMNDAMRAAPLAFLPIARWAMRLPLPVVRRFSGARARLDAVVYGIIAERRAAADAAARDDLLSMLLLATDPEETDGAPMSDAQLRDEVMTLFLAGHETTANALSWTWYLLAQHADVEARLHAELADVLGTGAAARAPTFDDLARLPYTRAVIAESMRLFPPAYAIGRICAESCVVGDVAVEPEWGVVTSPWLAHHDARWWPEPERFRPERWTGPPPDDRPKFAYFPFGGGSRICIGEQFAWTETTLVLATLASRWRMSLLPGQHVRPQARITLRQRPGARVELIERERTA